MFIKQLHGAPKEELKVELDFYQILPTGHSDNDNNAEDFRCLAQGATCSEKTKEFLNNASWRKIFSMLKTHAKRRLTFGKVRCVLNGSYVSVYIYNGETDLNMQQEYEQIEEQDISILQQFWILWEDFRVALQELHGFTVVTFMPQVYIKEMFISWSANATAESLSLQYLVDKLAGVNVENGKLVIRK